MLYEFVGVTLGHPHSSGPVTIVQDFNLAVRDGELLALTGPSGSGKTSILNAMAGFMRPLQGKVLFKGADLAAMSAAELATYRNSEIGIVHQLFNLFPDMDAVHNVMMPLLIRGVAYSDARGLAGDMLQKLGIANRGAHRPHEMSGGQQQRVAIGRALVTNPSVLLADEPTGNLDRAASDDFLQVLRDLHRSGDLTIVLVTHDESVASIATRRIDMDSGYPTCAHA